MTEDQASKAAFDAQKALVVAIVRAYGGKATLTDVREHMGDDVTGLEVMFVLFALKQDGRLREPEHGEYEYVEKS